MLTSFQRNPHFHSKAHFPGPSIIRQSTKNFKISKTAREVCENEITWSDSGSHMDTYLVWYITLDWSVHFSLTCVGNLISWYERTFLINSKPGQMWVCLCFPPTAFDSTQISPSFSHSSPFFYYMGQDTIRYAGTKEYWSNCINLYLLSF